MSIQSVLLPVLVHVALVFVLLGLTVKARREAAAAGVRDSDVRLSTEAYPAQARVYANSYSNQFEMPTLFLVAVAFGWVLHQTGWLFVLLEWVFVAFRIAQAAIHVTVNVLLLRGVMFLGSAIAVALLWVLIFVGVFVGTPIG